MGMREYGVLGYGFGTDQIRWDFNKLLRTFAPDECKEYSSEEPNIYEEFMRDVFEELVSTKSFLSYETACEDNDYIMIYAGNLWDFPKNSPKTEEQANKQMWDLISRYVKKDFSYKDFCKVVGEVDDTYFG